MQPLSVTFDSAEAKPQIQAKPGDFMKDLVAALQTLGFTEYEARIYLELSKQGQMTGYELAKATGLPRTNIYSSVQNLVEKNGAHRVQGEPARYVAVPIRELARSKQEQMDDTLRYLTSNLPLPADTGDAVITMSGDTTIVSKMRYLIDNAVASVYLDLWSEEIALLRPCLEGAYRRGLKVVLIAVGTSEIKVTETYDHGRDDEWATEKGRPIRLIADSKVALTGAVGLDGRSRALLSADPSLVELVKESLLHDMLLSEIKSAYGKELEGRFGKNLADLLHKN